VNLDEIRHDDVKAFGAWHLAWIKDVGASVIARTRSAYSTLPTSAGPLPATIKARREPLI
jgi:hypothetical protein